MDNLDKRFFEQMVEELKANGVPAVWLGGERHCGNYPELVAGMPGIYMADLDDRLSMFYPAAWKYHYGVHAAKQNVRTTQQ